MRDTSFSVFLYHDIVIPQKRFVKRIFVIFRPDTARIGFFVREFNKKRKKVLTESKNCTIMKIDEGVIEGCAVCAVQEMTHFFC